jgi:hypothetical protein
MTRQSSPVYRPGDIYAAHRCVHCCHLRYRGMTPEEPCRVCPCTDHVIPSEVNDEQPPAA